jgi:hypothetical protein
MTRRNLRSGTAALFVTALLLAPWPAQARPLESVDPFAGAVARFTEWITALFGDNRCTADPNGGCLGAGAAATPDYGCTMDPNGRCRDQSTAGDQIDIGCSLDPNGRCRESNATAEQIEIGCSLDPDGGACGNHS